jgi:hypothetical protein
MHATREQCRQAGRAFSLQSGGEHEANVDVFVNTSRQLLVDADFLYEGTCGRIGLSKNNERLRRNNFEGDPQKTPKPPFGG